MLPKEHGVLEELTLEEVEVFRVSENKTQTYLSGTIAPITVIGAFLKFCFPLLPCRLQLQ